jgi:hypothetical protein
MAYIFDNPTTWLSRGGEAVSDETFTRTLAIAAFMIAVVSFLIVTCQPAHAYKWEGVRYTLESAPTFDWTEASGSPDGYELFACDKDRAVCHYFQTISQATITLGGQRWIAACKRLGIDKAWLRTRAIRGEETGPYSECTLEKWGVGR